MHRAAVLMLILGALPAAAADAATREWSFTVHDPDRPDRHVAVAAIGPAEPVGPCPLLVLGHATMTPWTHYRYLAEPLAAAGWLVLLPDTENGLVADQAALADDMLLLVDLVRDRPDDLPVDLPEVAGPWALLGHSLGGGAAVLAAAAGDPGALVALAPQERARPSMLARAGDVAAPALVISGELDCITPPDAHHAPLHAGLASTPRAHAVLAGGGHCAFATPCEPCTGAEVGCPPELEVTEQQARTRALVEPWLAWHVRGDDTAREEFLAAAGMAGVTVDLVEPPTAAPVPVGPVRLVLVDAGHGGGPVRWRLDASDSRPVRATLHDLRGRLVRRLVSSHADRARMLRWDGTDDAGRRAPAGVYLLRVVHGEQVLRSRVVRLD
jgi:dienelactone hydrolase